MPDPEPPTIAGSPSRTSPDSSPGAEEGLLARVSAGDESAFATLVDAHGSWMLRIARSHVASRTLAEDVVQETWLKVLRGLHRFERRSSFRTWALTILVNCARTEAARERRSMTFSDLADSSGDDATAGLVDRLFAQGHPRWANAWSTVVERWDALPENRLLSREVRAAVDAELARMPPRQQQVLSLRDVEGWSSLEVCQALKLSESNQKVLLHRARLRVRAALERYFGEEAAA